MANYQEAVAALQQQLESAKQALSRDVAVAVASRDWSVMLRDRFDVDALVEHLDQELKEVALVEQLHARADKARQQQRQRGRPRKRSEGDTKATRPTFGFGISRVAPKPAATVTTPKVG